MKNSKSFACNTEIEIQGEARTKGNSLDAEEKEILACSEISAENKQALIFHRRRWKLAASNFRSLGVELTPSQVKDLANGYANIKTADKKLHFQMILKAIDGMIDDVEFCKLIISKRTEIESTLDYPPYNQSIRSEGS